MTDPNPQRRGAALTIRRFFVVVVVCIVMGSPGISRCQAAGRDAAGETRQVERFEVASVRPVAEKDRGSTEIGKYGLPRFTMKNARLSLLISFAYGVPADRFVGAPKGLEDVAFDVDAKSEGDVPLTYERLQPLMQNLLGERFGLVAHTAHREEHGYGLVVAKGGPKLMKAPPNDGPAYIMRDQIRGSGVRMSAFAGMLTAAMNEPVKDRTGIAGTYDIVLHFAPQDGAENADAGLPSLFTAVKEQLGLELKAEPVTVTTLMIEHINKTATPD